MWLLVYCSMTSDYTVCSVTGCVVTSQNHMIKSKLVPIHLKPVLCLKTTFYDYFCVSTMMYWLSTSINTTVAVIILCNFITCDKELKRLTSMIFCKVTVKLCTIVATNTWCHFLFSVHKDAVNYFTSSFRNVLVTHDNTCRMTSSYVTLTHVNCKDNFAENQTHNCPVHWSLQQYDWLQYLILSLMYTVCVQRNIRRNRCYSFP